MWGAPLRMMKRESASEMISIDPRRLNLVSDPYRPGLYYALTGNSHDTPDTAASRFDFGCDPFQCERRSERSRVAAMRGYLSVWRTNGIADFRRPQRRAGVRQQSALSLQTHLSGSPGQPRTLGVCRCLTCRAFHPGAGTGISIVAELAAAAW